MFGVAVIGVEPGEEVAAQLRSPADFDLAQIKQIGDLLILSGSGLGEFYGFGDGLRRIDALSQEMSGKTFVAASPEQRVAVLTRLSANQKEEPKSADDKFWRELKGATVHGYYTSEIGIHQEMEYKGNVLQGEYAGEEPT